jgi:hypothetical protein
MLMRFDFSGTPSRAICTPPGVLRGALHYVHGHLRAEGEEWVYVGNDSATTLVFRFRVAPGSRDAQAAGVLRGASVDAGGLGVFPPSGNRVEIEDGSFTGQWSIGPGLLGTVIGTLLFTGPDGARMTCTEVRLQMAPGPPPGT